MAGAWIRAGRLCHGESKESGRPVALCVPPLTAISTLFGFLPLMLASGAGAQSQASLGLVVFGGLSVATVLSTLVVPVFYVVMKNLVGKAGPSAGAA